MQGSSGLWQDFFAGSIPYPETNSKFAPENGFSPRNVEIPALVSAPFSGANLLLVSESRWLKLAALSYATVLETHPASEAISIWL